MSSTPDGNQAPLLDSRQRHGHDFDIQTTDRGRASGQVVTSVLRDGELVATRNAPYLPNSPPDFVRNMMFLHHQEVLSELDGGALDSEIAATVSGIPAASAQATLVDTPRVRAVNNNPQQLSSAVAVVAHTPPVGKAIPIYTVKFPEPRSFLDLYYSRNGQHGFLVETQDLTDLGREVELRIRILRPRERLFTLMGTVTWKRPRGTQTLKPGIGVDIRKESVPALERLVDTALGIQDPAGDRAHPRVNCNFDGSLATPSGTLPVKVGNLSLGGAYLRPVAPVAIPPGTQVTLHLKTGFLSSFKLKATVQWSAEAPFAAGIRFLEEPPPRLTELVEKLVRA